MTPRVLYQFEGNPSSVVYACKNVITGDTYVGETKQSLKTRIRQHRYDQRHSRKDTAFYDDVAVFGWNNYEWQVLEFAPESELLEVEKYYINLCGTLNIENRPDFVKSILDL